MFFIKSGICSGFIRAKISSKVFEDALIIFFRIVHLLEHL